jgi:hypothetical protein
MVMLPQRPQKKSRFDIVCDRHCCSLVRVDSEPGMRTLIAFAVHAAHVALLIQWESCNSCFQKLFHRKPTAT